MRPTSWPTQGSRNSRNSCLGINLRINNMCLPEYHHDLVENSLHFFLGGLLIASLELRVDKLCYQFGRLVLPSVDERLEGFFHADNELFVGREADDHDHVELCGGFKEILTSHN